MNIKKKIAVLTSAAICGCVMATYGFSAGATITSETMVNKAVYATSEEQEAASAIISAAADTTPLTKEQKAIFNELKKQCSAPYSAKIAAYVKKLDGKTSKTQRTYAKSYSKKFYDKVTKLATAYAKDPANSCFAISLRNTNTIIDVAAKGAKMKMIMFAEGTGMIVIVDEQNMYLLDPSTKTGYSSPITDDIKNSMDMSDATSMLEENDLSKEKADVFTFTIGDQKYTYERFGKTGIVFTSKGTPVMIYENDVALGIKVSSTVKDSAFTVPAGYTTVDASAAAGN